MLKLCFITPLSPLENNNPFPYDPKSSISLVNRINNIIFREKFVHFNFFFLKSYSLKIITYTKLPCIRFLFTLYNKVGVVFVSLDKRAHRYRSGRVRI